MVFADRLASEDSRFRLDEVRLELEAEREVNSALQERLLAAEARAKEAEAEKEDLERKHDEQVCTEREAIVAYFFVPFLYESAILTQVEEVHAGYCDDFSELEEKLRASEEEREGMARRLEDFEREIAAQTYSVSFGFEEKSSIKDE